jgi:hypothetical protein
MTSTPSRPADVPFERGRQLKPAGSLDVMQRTVDWFRSHLR